MKLFKKILAAGIPSLAWLLSFSPLSGWAADDYTVFHGRQTWPTVKHAMANMENTVPIYDGWPDRPYRVIGTLPIAEKPNSATDHLLAQAAETAKSKGGDAIILRHTAKLEPLVMAGTTNATAAISPVKTRILVIQWKTEREIAAAQRAEEAFWTHFQATHPGVTLTDLFKQLSMENSAYQGLDLASPEDSARLEADLNCVLAGHTNGVPAKWLFRGAVHMSGFAASVDETFCGLAQVTQSGDHLNITFQSEAGGFNFTGLDQNERLNGDIEMSAGPSVCKAKALGVVLPNQITLDSRAQNPEGSVRATYTFLR